MLVDVDRKVGVLLADRANERVVLLPSEFLDNPLKPLLTK